MPEIADEPPSGDAVISGVPDRVGREKSRRAKPSRFTLRIATLNDRTTRDVTSDATWISGDGQVVSIASPGDVTGHQTGTAMIEAE